MGIVDFGVKTTTGMVDYVRRAGQDVYRNARTPGAEWRVMPFTPGSATTGAGLTKLAAAVLAGARAEANDAERRRRQAVAERAAALGVQKLERDLAEPRYSYKTTSGEVISGLTPDQRADMEPKPPQPRQTMKLKQGMVGYAAGTDVDPAELNARVSLENTRTRNDQTRGNRAQSQARANAEAVLRYVDKETSPTGNRAAMQDANSDDYARMYQRNIMRGTKAQRMRANQALGLDPNFKVENDEDRKILAGAMDSWRTAYRGRLRVRTFQTLEPKRRAAQSVIDRYGLVDGEAKTDDGEGMSAEEEAAASRFSDLFAPQR